MKWYSKAQITIVGQCDAVYSMKRIVEGVSKAGEVGAGVEVFAKTGSGTVSLGYFDGDGLDPVSVSNVTEVRDENEQPEQNH